ncbi:hypothetical protein Cni_G10752 [Canna indica]|uniref:Uncharacterized protein n=1 Tax=Canna indica TaxID=4628 RepID=A0AAQ3K785_9LILI|nr:hypothetical protein Cni_G10752 [Canna indica]
MPSEILAARTEDGSMIEIQLNQDEKRRSMQYHSSKSSKEKCSFPNGIKNIDFLEKFGALKSEKLPRQTAKDRLEVKKNSAASPFGNSQKPWPSRRVTGFDDPVMNMSNVPFYLKRMEKEDNVHEKALNVGVLEWGLLKKWTEHQKCVTDVGGGDSASTSTESSTFSTLGFSNQSCRTISSPLSQGKQSPVLPSKELSISDSPTKMHEKENSRHIELIEGICGSRMGSTKLPAAQYKHDPDEDLFLNANPLGHKHNKGNSIDSDSKAKSSKVRLASHSATPPLRYKIDNATAVRVPEGHNCSLMKEEKSVVSPNSLSWVNDVQQFSHHREELWDYLQENVDNGCLGSNSLVTTDCWLDDRNDYNHSGNLAESFEMINHFPQVPHSCPLPATILNDELDMPCNLQLENKVQTDKSICGNVDDKIFSRGSCKEHKANTTQESRQSEAKAMAAAGKKSSIHPSAPERISKSSSMKEVSFGEQFEPISLLYNSHRDQPTRNNKGRQSPLRRFLDPIMKPKNNLHLNGIIATVPKCTSGELRTEKSSLDLQKPSNRTLDSTCQTRGSIITSNELSNNGKGTPNDERHVISMRQALLQVAWKNGLPLFMLSSCDSDVLAAAITMQSVGNDDDPECIYRIFSVNGSKKKSMFWSHPGNKGKKNQLISTVVGQLKVSLCKLRISQYAVREFVLLDADKPVGSRGKRELAAIVVEVPPSTAKSNSPTIEYRSNCREPLSTYSGGNVSVSNDHKCLQTNQHRNDIAQSGISVIIPSGVHGLPTDGEPSPLIERWRSGGICDCGGWDEGCMLTILGNKFEEKNSCDPFQRCQTTDGTHRFELFIQGASQDKGFAFNMVSFKEGLYAVNFQSSISLLQAFAICISVLHGRKLSSYPTRRKSLKLKDHIVNDKLMRSTGRTQDGDPSSYVPNHPPLSPVGRA